LAAEKILIIEEDINMQHMLTLLLKEQQFQVIIASDAQGAVQCLYRENPDVILLEICLTDDCGYKLCETIRKITDSPILIVSSKHETISKVKGLESGADDYIIKPVDPEELIARIKAMLRRRSLNRLGKDKVLRFDGLEIDLSDFTVTVNEKPIPLYTKELQLLIFLATNPNQVFSTEQLYNKIWGDEYVGDPNTVIVHLSTLRKKIEQDPAKPKYIITVRGFGYKFVPNIEHT
jgi:DNA-binding response OmpR family regulator